MNQRSAWLARSLEAAIDPELPICDPHHHLWDFPGSRYLAEELMADLDAGHRVVATVFVECDQQYRADGPAELRPVGETEFVEQLATANDRQGSATRIAAGIVGFADLTLGAAVQPVLEAHLRASRRFRGVRHASAWDASDQIRKSHKDPARFLLRSPEFRAGLQCLTRLGLSFDAWLYHPQIPELTELATSVPDATIIFDHMGGPLGVGPYATARESVFAEWRANMAELATCPNVVVKLGGRTMTMSGFGWHKRPAPPSSIELAQAMGPYYRSCIEFFGAQRCMFESNWPMDSPSCSYTTLWNAFKRLAREYTPAERAALLHDTAVRVYRL
ncbi:MAG: amidohydrolase family protein [Steroidobacteraceae bacterium]